MSAISFVAIVVVLAFITGFFVAAIIWGISWAISPKDQRTTIPGFVKIFNSYYKPHLNGAHATALSKSLMGNEEAKNKELYRFYHGKN